MKIVWLFGLLSLAGLSGLSAQTPDDDFLPGLEPVISGELEPTKSEYMMFAQAPGDKPPMRGNGRPWRGMEQARQRKHLEQLRMLKMLELLELREDQEVEFLTTYNAMRREHRELDEQINAVLDSLSIELRAPDPSDENILRFCEQVARLDSEKKMVGVQFGRKAGNMLSAEQLGRLVIFQKRFESEMLERVGRFRQGRDRGPGGSLQDDG